MSGMHEASSFASPSASPGCPYLSERVVALQDLPGLELDGHWRGQRRVGVSLEERIPRAELLLGAFRPERRTKSYHRLETN